ncbi:hypothetical protein [Psychrobacter sp. I-STPA6b]|uniref:hypothetical protein n=1 Tax=Psychrobacter sp. I-STPA6b TaxID=2585718 RepID=UPI001D0C403A|nr:hypothetical protein [Psychrobacter sp. I-STPA6b]
MNLDSFVIPMHRFELSREVRETITTPEYLAYYTFIARYDESCNDKIIAEVSKICNLNAEKTKELLKLADSGDISKLVGMMPKTNHYIYVTENMFGDAIYLTIEDNIDLSEEVYCSSHLQGTMSMFKISNKKEGGVRPKKETIEVLLKALHSISVGDTQERPTPIYGANPMAVRNEICR